MRRNMFMCFLLAFCLVACELGGDSGGGSRNSSSSSSDDYSYNGPGSNWSIDIDGNSFELEETDNNLEINGTISDLSSGFKKLTVTSASGTGAPSVGDQAYALDVPGTVFLLKPLEANSEIIAMVSSGSCPSSSQSMNWIVTKMDVNADSSDEDQDVLGTFTTDGTNATLPFQYSLTGKTVGTNVSLGSFSCSNGKATVSDAEMYLTSAGGAIVRTGYSTPNDDDDDGIILAMPSESISSGDANGDYVGLVFTSNDTYPVKANVSGATVTVNQIDPDTGSNSGSVNDTLNISGFNSPNTGFVTGSLQSDSNKKVTCNVNTNLNSSGKGIIFCSGMDAVTSGDDALFAVLLIEK